MNTRTFYKYAAVLAFVLTLLISVSYINTTAQSASNSNICLATVETSTGQGRFSVAGQGRFSVAGQGRFSVAGQEGPDGALTLGDGNLDQSEIDEILNNVIDPSWLIDTVLKYPDLGEQRVAILVVDDFADFTLTLEEIYALDPLAEEEVAEYYEKIGETVPDKTTEITSVPHGETVIEVIETLIAAAEESYGTLNIDAFPVDISVGGEYRLDLLASSLNQAIRYYYEIGYNNIVVNMSFGFIPCTDNSFGVPFNFASFLETRYDEIIFNVDGGLDIENQTVPTFYSDFGIQQYFLYYMDIPFENTGTYLATLFNSISGDDDDNGMAAFNNLVDYWLQEAKNNNNFSFLPVASSGNYRDFFVEEGWDPQPLAPARFPEIFAASATLGMDGDLWEYSQNGSMKLPGAWWKFRDNSYRAGTSYAAPYLSVIGALYLTSDNPPACDFSNGLPIAGNKMLWDNSHFLRGRLLCSVNPAGIGEPTPTPETPTPETPTPETPTPETPTPETPTPETPTPETPTPETPTPETPTPEPTPTTTVTELITNGGFEEFVSRKAPIGWKVKNSTKDKVVCNKDKNGDGTIDKFFANTGKCAWRFKGVPGERSKLIQRIDTSVYSLNVGDGFQLQLFADSRILPRTVIKMRVQFSDGDNVTEKFRILQTTGYQEFTTNHVLERTDVEFVKLIFVNKTETRRLHIDDVSLKLYQTSALREQPLIPLPEVPASMRD